MVSPQLGGTNKERRQGPAIVALVSEGLQLRNRSGWIESKEENPAEDESSGGVCGLDG